MQKMNAGNVAGAVMAGLILIVGCAFYFTGSAQPVYTDVDAPARLSQELQDLPRDERFKAWYEQLPAYETTHKQYTDIGRGLISLALGILAGMVFLKIISRLTNGKRLLVIIAFWLGLWGIKFPLSAWYYSLRQGRFEYPVWGDSIAIGLFQDYAAWVIGDRI